MIHALEIHHDLGDVLVKPVVDVNRARLKRMIQSTLDNYLSDDRVPAQVIHDEARLRHGDYYRTPGYFLRMYRLRAELTQAELAGQTGIHQRRISEMENNKRTMDQAMASRLAQALDCDYQRLLYGNL
ncbi:MAG: helix-turn-helix transcriptional regulator [Gammaproteobacteria bacterium]|nr:helix-turn-helix transcriptional regulator [Gammaproteobacteria bacterium]MCY4281634.1 helix-turn-helix transcriptional regulator [Gammaproteobacteria bacterium]